MCKTHFHAEADLADAWQSTAGDTMIVANLTAPLTVSLVGGVSLTLPSGCALQLWWLTPDSPVFGGIPQTVGRGTSALLSALETMLASGPTKVQLSTPGSATKPPTYNASE